LPTLTAVAAMPAARDHHKAAIASQLPVDARANDGNVLRALGRIEEARRRKRP